MLEQIFVVGSIMLDCACGERHSASGFFFCFWLPGVAIIRVLYGVFLCFIACSSLCLSLSLSLSLSHTHKHFLMLPLDYADWKIESQY